MSRERSNTRAVVTACPDPEVLAAFVDGRLAPSERLAVAEHLTSCEACYEIVAETMHVLDDLAEEDEDAPVAVAPRARRWPVWAGSLAAVLAVCLGGLLWWRLAAAGRLGVDELARALAAEPGALAEGWDDPGWSRNRGTATGLDEPALAFRLGARSVDLRVALAAGDPKLAGNLIRESVWYLQDVAFADALVVTYRGIADDLDAGKPLTEVAAGAAKAEELVETFLDSPRFALGRWAEAGRLAALAGHGEHFTRAAARRAPPAGEDGWPPAVETELGRIRAALAGERGPDLGALTEAFGRIVEIDGGAHVR